VSVVLGVVGALFLAGSGALGYRKLVELGFLRYNRWDRRVRGSLREGDPAIDVEVTTWEGAPLRLSTLWRARPVVLIFGSCT
jgi:hypothetical protein